MGAVDLSLAGYDLRTLEDHVDVNLGLRRIPARIFMVFGPLLLVVAGIGIDDVAA